MSCVNVPIVPLRMAHRRKVTACVRESCQVCALQSGRPHPIPRDGRRRHSDMLEACFAGQSRRSRQRRIRRCHACSRMQRRRSTPISVHPTLCSERCSQSHGRYLQNLNDGTACGPGARAGRSVVDGVPTPVLSSSTLRCHAGETAQCSSQIASAAVRLLSRRLRDVQGQDLG